MAKKYLPVAYTPPTAPSRGNGGAFERAARDYRLAKEALAKAQTDSARAAAEARIKDAEERTKRAEIGKRPTVQLFGPTPTETFLKLPGALKDWGKMIKAIAIVLLIIFLVFGGLAAVSSIFTMMPWWIWVLAIFIALVYWRKRR